MIQRKTKPCKCGCGREGFLFAKGMLRDCWAKNNKKPLRKVSEKQKEKKIIKTDDTKKLHEWFLQIWDKTENSNGYCFCFETGKPMHRSIYRNNSCCYHHPLEKSNPKYKQFRMEEWNILIVLPEIHNQIHSDIDKTPRVKNYTTQLKEKF